MGRLHDAAKCTLHLPRSQVEYQWSKVSGRGRKQNPAWYDIHFPRHCRDELCKYIMELGHLLATRLPKCVVDKSWILLRTFPCAISWRMFHLKSRVTWNHRSNLAVKQFRSLIHGECCHEFQPGISLLHHPWGLEDGSLLSTLNVRLYWGCLWIPGTCTWQKKKRKWEGESRHASAKVRLFLILMWISGAAKYSPGKDFWGRR